MAVVVKKTTENFYKVHRILTPDGAVFELSATENEAELTPAGESPETGSLATPISSASNNSISETAAGVNGEIPSTEGKILRGNDPVQIADIDTAGNGKLTVKLADGSTADVTELSFPNEGEQELWRVMAEYADNAEAARQLLKEYRAGDLRAFEYAKGVEEGFLYGKLNIGPDEMSRRGSYVNLLNPMQRNMAYKYGQFAGEKQIRQRQKTVDAVYKQAKNILQQKGKTEGNTYGVTLAKGVSLDNMSPSQKAAFQLAEQIAPAVKANIQVYNGKSEWGYYNPRTDTICLNINAKWNNRSMMACTLGHELVHRNKKGSPMKYKAFADFLVQEYGKQGSDIRAMIDQQLKAADEFDKRVPENERLNMTEEEAFEEVVADACQRMLLDTDAGKRLAEFGARSQENRNFLKDFGKWLKELLDKLRSIFEGVESDSIAATEFAKFDKGVKQILADMFVDMSVDAGEKLSTIKEAGLTEKITTENGGVKYSINGRFYDQLDKWDMETVGFSFVLGDTSEALQKANIPQKQIRWDASKIKTLLSKHNGMTIGIVRKIPELLEKPIIIIDSKHNDNAKIVMGDLYDEHGKVVTVVLLLTPTSRKGNVLDVVKISSAEGRSHIKSLFIKENGTAVSIRYVDKKRIQSWLNVNRLQLPLHNLDLDSNISIRNPEQDVNQNSEKNEKMPHKLPVSKDITDRAMLVDMFEQMVTNSREDKGRFSVFASRLQPFFYHSFASSCQTACLSN